MSQKNFPLNILDLHTRSTLGCASSAAMWNGLSSCRNLIHHQHIDDQSSRHRPCRRPAIVRGELENSCALICRERRLLLREPAMLACSCTLLRGCTLQMARAVHKAAATQSHPKTVLSMGQRRTLLPLQAGTVTVRYRDI